MSNSSRRGGGITIISNTTTINVTIISNLVHAHSQLPLLVWSMLLAAGRHILRPSSTSQSASLVSCPFRHAFSMPWAFPRPCQVTTTSATIITPHPQSRQRLAEAGSTRTSFSRRPFLLSSAASL